MNVSVVIPVWNGENIIYDCLTQLFSQSKSLLKEVLCVDNASSDGSVRLIRQHFPQAKILQQSTNLGFAGGVNVGITAATGDLIVLLNQDCIVQPKWLEHIVAAMVDYPQFAVAGCTILDPDGSLNHGGASLQQPRLFSIHHRKIPSSQPVPMDTVTGAVFVIRPSTVDEIGLFDEGFYPAYYEETDYCYRVRRTGKKVGYIPNATVQHLFSSREWLVDPLRHQTMLARSRYRFAVKHVTEDEIATFLQSETEANQQEVSFEQAGGCAIAARQTVRALAEIAARVQQDFGKGMLPAAYQQWTDGLLRIQKIATRRAFYLSEQDSNELIRNRDDLLTRIYFQPQFRPQSTEGTVSHWKRQILRGLSLISGRDYLLQRKLAFLNLQHLNQLDQRARLLEGLRSADE